MIQKCKKIIVIILGIATLVFASLAFIAAPSINIFILICNVSNIISAIVILFYLLKFAQKVKQGIIIYTILQIISAIFLIFDYVSLSLKAPDIFESEYNYSLRFYTVLIGIISIFIYSVIIVGAFKKNKAINVAMLILLFSIIVLCVIAYANYFLSLLGLIKHITGISFAFWLWYEYVAYKIKLKVKKRKNKIKSNITLEELKEKADKGQISEKEYNILKKKIIDSL